MKISKHQIGTLVGLVAELGTHLLSISNSLFSVVK